MEGGARDTKGKFQRPIIVSLPSFSPSLSFIHFLRHVSIFSVCCSSVAYFPVTSSHLSVILIHCYHDLYLFSRYYRTFSSSPVHSLILNRLLYFSQFLPTSGTKAMESNLFSVSPHELIFWGPAFFLQSHFRNLIKIFSVPTKATAVNFATCP